MGWLHGHRVTRGSSSLQEKARILLESQADDAADVAMGRRCGPILPGGQRDGKGAAGGLSSTQAWRVVCLVLVRYPPGYLHLLPTWAPPTYLGASYLPGYLLPDQVGTWVAIEIVCVTTAGEPNAPTIPTATPCLGGCLGRCFVDDPDRGNPTLFPSWSSRRVGLCYST